MPMLGVQGLWAGKDLYRPTPTAEMPTTPILAEFLSILAIKSALLFELHPKDPSPHLVASCDTRGMWRIYSNLEPQGGNKKKVYA
jgi:hypothetical protein